MLLVIDATTGQNGMIQAKVFGEIVDVTVWPDQAGRHREGRYRRGPFRGAGRSRQAIGLGEGPDDLAPFDPEAFVDALLD